MNKDIVFEVSNRINRYRKEHGLSKAELADKSGVHCSYIGQLERGIKTPTIETLYKISNALDMTLSEFLSDFEEVAIREDEQKNVAQKCYRTMLTMPLDKQEDIEELFEMVAAYVNGENKEDTDDENVEDSDPEAEEDINEADAE